MLPKSSTKQIPLTRGQFAIVDEADFAIANQYKWHAIRPHRIWYAVRTIWGHGENSSQYLHRFLLGNPQGVSIDHVDGNGLNCARSNLRIATKSQNDANRGRQENNKSGYKGVHWATRDKKWIAKIKVDGRQIYVGGFDNPVDAALAYDAAAHKYFGAFAGTNF